jgi:hypothetical protein
VVALRPAVAVFHNSPTSVARCIAVLLRYFVGDASCGHSLVPLSIISPPSRIFILLCVPVQTAVTFPTFIPLPTMVLPCASIVSSGFAVIIPTIPHRLLVFAIPVSVPPRGGYISPGPGGVASSRSGSLLSISWRYIYWSIPDQPKDPQSTHALDGLHDYLDAC